MVILDFWKDMFVQAFWQLAEHAAYLTMFAVFNTEMCANSIVTSLVSPTGSFRAVLFERNCGATTDFSTQISLLRKGETFKDSGNVFVADSNNGAAKAASWGGPYASIEWIDDQTLLVKFDSNAEVFRQEDSRDGVAIKFKKVDR